MRLALRSGGMEVFALTIGVGEAENKPGEKGEYEILGREGIDNDGDGQCQKR